MQQIVIELFHHGVLASKMSDGSHFVSSMTTGSRDPIARLPLAAACRSRGIETAASMLPPRPQIPRLNAPIVLAHGLFGFTRIGLGRITLTPYFRSIPELLRGAGNRVLVTRVPSIAGVEHRAGRLGEQIFKAFPDEPVHLIGHSMGGLDAPAAFQSRLAAAGFEPFDDRNAPPGNRPGGLREIAGRPGLPYAELDGYRSSRLP